MTSINPGPAVTSTPNSVLVTEPVITQVNSIPQFTSAIRLLALARSIVINSGLGDIAVLPLINTTSFIPTAIYFANALSATGASASAAALTVSLNGGPNVTGTSFVASAALTALTGLTKYVSSTIAISANTSVQTATMGASSTPSNYLYLNSTVISAAAATCDLFVYGYDIS
jgi:hypothetical protein